jgi:hypothetical protein
MPVLFNSVERYVNPQEVIDFGKAVSDVVGLTPPNFAPENEGTIRAVKGTGKETADWVRYGLDMANNATMFMPALHEKAVASAGRAGPLMNSLVNPTYGFKSVKGNLSGAGATMVGTYMIDELADSMVSDGDEMMNAVKAARFRGRYDLADRILAKANAYDMTSEDVRSFSHGASVGSVAGLKGATVGALSTVPVSAYRHAAGGTTQRGSMDDGFYDNYKRRADDKIISLIASRDPEMVSEAMHMYTSQLDAVAHGSRSISTIDQRVLDAINSLGNEKLSGLYGMAKDIGKKGYENNNMSIEELERLATPPKSMTRRQSSKKTSNNQKQTKGNFGYGY